MPTPSHIQKKSAMPTICEAIEQMQQKALTSESLLQRCVQRIAQREKRIQAWSHLNVGHALAAACQADQEPSLGLLHGIPIGIKDIIDTAGMPTRYGSATYARLQR